MSSSNYAKFTGLAGSGGGGGGITALTGNVTASGSGSVVATLSTIPNKRYIDFTSGNDSNTGTLVSPWKTIQHAYNSISPTLANPFVFYLSGGTDTDTAITAKPNVSLTSDTTITIVPDFTISGGSTDDSITLNNVQFSGAFSWVRNDSSNPTIYATNVFFNNNFIFQQNGAGIGNIIANSCSYSNNAEFLSNLSLIDCFFVGNTTFDDVTNSKVYQFQGGINLGAMSFSGAPIIYISGFIHDTSIPATVTFVTTANGSATVEMDSNGLPPTYTGTPGSITYLSQVAYLNGAFAQAYFSNASSWSTVSTSFADPTNSGGNALTVRLSSGITLTAAGSNLPGITFTPASSSSVYLITANVAVYNGVVADNVSLQMTDGTTVISTAGGWQQGASAADAASTIPLTGIYAPGTGSAVTVKIQIAANAGNAEILCGNTGTGLQNSIEWTILQIK